jgi:hypothetical protein
MILPQSLPLHGQDEVGKPWEQQSAWSLTSSQPVQKSGLVFSPPTLWHVQGSPVGFDTCCLWGTNWRRHVEQVGTCLVHSYPAHCSQQHLHYTKQWSFYSESIPKVENWPFYKSLHLVYLDLKRLRIWPREATENNQAHGNWAIHFWMISGSLKK